MKKLLILLTITLLLVSCNKDDQPKNPIDALPPITTTGENTFGALLDGEVFIPSGGINPLDCVYQLIEGKRFLSLQGNKEDANFNLIRLSISTKAKNIEEGETYQLIENEE